MSNESRENLQTRVLVLEGNTERGILIADRLVDHGMESLLVSDKDEFMKALQAEDFHCAIICDTEISSQEAMQVGQDARAETSAKVFFVLLTQNKQIHPADAHRYGFSHVMKGNINFSELCDLVERLAGTGGQRLFDGSQVRFVNQLGKISGIVTGAGAKNELKLDVSSLGAGGFYYEFDAYDGSVPAEGKVLQFDLKLMMFPDYRLHGKGIVSWVKKLKNGKFAVGIEFVAIPKESEMLLRAFTELFKIKHYIPTSPT